MLIGKSKAEVRRLLGGNGNNSGNSESDDWYYTLGFKPSAIDPSSLDVVFKNGKVTAVEANYHD
jgi:hypothetical protein